MCAVVFSKSGALALETTPISELSAGEPYLRFDVVLRPTKALCAKPAAGQFDGGMTKAFQGSPIAHDGCASEFQIPNRQHHRPVVFVGFLKEGNETDTAPRFGCQAKKQRV